MKKFFRLVSTLAVAGLAFAYTGCTDYSEDVNRLDERIDGHIATTEEQYKKLEEADGKLQKAIDEANKSIDALEANTASLQSELTALKEKHVADITALSKEHAADKAALELALSNKAADLQKAITELDGKYATELAKMKSAYEQADTELRNQISQNATKISALESSVKNINDVVIPEVKQQIAALKDEVAKTYATKEDLAAAKTELSKATADAIGKVNEEIGKLDERLKTVEKDLKNLSDAHESLKTSFEDTKADHESRIANLETSLATLEKTHTDDVTALRGLISDAKTAADNAQKAADNAKTAADNAQTTADNAVAAAAAAKTAAENAQATASEALGKVDKLIAALGLYAKDGILAAKIEALVNADNALAEKDILLAAEDARLAALYDELAKKDTEFAGLIVALQNKATELERQYGDIAGKVADLEAKDITLEAKDAEFEKLIDGLTKEDVKIYAEIQKTNAKVADVEQAIKDAKTFCLNKIAELSETLQESIKEVYNYTEAELAKKFDKSEFAGSFSEAFKTAFDGENYEEAFNRLFSGKLTEADGEFSTTVNGLFTEAFKTAFGGMNYTDAFNDLFKTALASEGYRNDFDNKFNDFLDAALLPEGKVGVKFEEAAKALKDAVKDLKDNYITPLENKVDDAIARIDKRAGDIILVIGDLANRIQSVTFVPEYDDMCASLYYYYIYNDEEGKSYPLSDKTVVASFEVYPRSQAENVAKMLENGGASIVAVPLKHSFTRGAAEAATATIKSAVAANGIVKVEAIFGEGVDYELPEYPSGTPVISSAADHASSFAIALRVEVPAETEINTVDEEGNAKVEKKDAGKYIESAYVPVRLAHGCNLAGKFDIYYFEKNEKDEYVAVKPFDECVTRNVAWSADRDTTKWNYFGGAQYAIQIAEKGESYDETTTTYKTLAQAAKIMNLDDVTKITPALKVDETVLKDGKDVTKTHKKFFITETPGTLAGSQIDLSEEAAKDPENSVNSSMLHGVSFSLKVGETTLANVIEPRSAVYNILRREVKFMIDPFVNNKIEWTYKLARELTSGSTIINKAYDKPIQAFNKENKVRRIDSEKDVKIKLGALLKKAPSYYIVNGELKDKSYRPIDIRMVAEDVDDIVKVMIPGGKYQFLNGKEHKYDITAVYAVDGEFQTDYKVDFSYVLGAMPNHVTVTLDKFAFDYVVKGDAVKTFTEKEAVDMTKKQMTAAEVNMFIDGEDDRLWESINQESFGNDPTGTKRTSGKTETPFDKLSYMTRLSIVLDGITVKAAYDDIQTFEDLFTYKTVRKTWYGVNYTYQTAGNVEIKNPGFSLINSVRSDLISKEKEPKVFRADISNQDITKSTDYYQLNKTINLSEYFDVKKGSVDYNNLVVVYDRLTEENAENGIINVPVIETEVVNVNPSVSVYTYKIDPSYISWLNAISYENSVAKWFTAQNYNVGLTLKYDGKTLDTAELQLVTDNPIDRFEFDKNVISVSTGNKKANLWEKMNVYGVVDKDAQLIWHESLTLKNSIEGWHSAPDQKINAKTYGCKVTFAPLKEVRVYVGGVATSINDTKFVYDANAGTITFTGDLADLKKDVTFEIDAVLNHFLDYAGKQPKTATAVVTFQK